MDVAVAAHQNLVDFTRWCAVLDPDARLYDDLAAGAVAVAAGADWPSTHMAVGMGNGVAGATWARAAHDFLMSEGNTACVFIREQVDDEAADALIALGYQEYTRSPEQVCEAPLPEVEPGEGVSLRLATTPDDVAAYASVASQAFVDLGFSEDSLREQLDHPDAMLADGVTIALADVGGRTMAGAMSVLVGDTPNAYVGWVACLAEGRGHGLGDLVTRTVTNQGFAKGAGIVTLEASRFGESVYRRMGYRDLYHYRLLVKI
jgi:hypothetical protein